MKSKQKSSHSSKSNHTKKSNHDNLNNYSFLDIYQKKINHALNLITSDSKLPLEIRSMLRYFLQNGGKRLRAIVTILSCEVVGGKIEHALDYAVGVELIHNASLIIDDMIDHDNLRRNNPSVHSKYGIEMALVCASLLLSMAIVTTSSKPKIFPSIANAMYELGIGQAHDVQKSAKNVKDYLSLANQKTAALFNAASMTGGMCGNGKRKDISSLSKYGKNLGLAFQISDDILSIRSSQTQTGKPTATDLKRGKPSIVTIELAQKLGTDLEGLQQMYGNHSRKKLSKIANDSDVIKNAELMRNNYIQKAIKSLSGLSDNTSRKNLEMIAIFLEHRVS